MPWMWWACDGLAGSNCWLDLCFVTSSVTTLCVYKLFHCCWPAYCLLHQHEWSGLVFSCKESRAVLNCKCCSLYWRRICVTAVSLSRWVWLKMLYHHQPPFSSSPFFLPLSLLIPSSLPPLPCPPSPPFSFLFTPPFTLSSLSPRPLLLFSHQEGPHSALKEEEFFDALEMAYQNDEVDNVSYSTLNFELWTPLGSSATVTFVPWQ